MTNGSAQKSPADVYTLLLALALLALIVATVFLYLETTDYSPNLYTGGPSVGIPFVSPAGSRYEPSRNVPRGANEWDHGPDLVS